MPKVSPIQSNFNGGEVSPLLLGRVDFDAYERSLKKCLNLIPYVQGGITRRPPTQFSDEVKDSTKKTRGVKFQFSTTQAYIIEFGENYIRFKRNQGPVALTPLVITNITQANPAVATYTGTDPNDGDHVRIAGIVGMTEFNNVRVATENVDTGAKTFEVGEVDSSAYDAYVSGGTAAVIYEISSTYLESELFDMKFTQSADVLYIFHPNHPPAKLTRTAHTSWTLTDIVFTDGPYRTVNTSETTMTPSATTGSSITITASAATFTLATDVGRMIRIQTSDVWGYAVITAVASNVSVTADIFKDFGGTGAVTSWRLGLWSITTGFPTTGTFFENRLCFGGNAAEPQRVDGSRTALYEDMTPTDPDGVVVPDHAISVTLVSDDVQVIRWMRGEERGMLVGTVEGEWIIRPSTAGEALTPTNIAAKQATSHGSANTQPLKAGKAVLYVQKSGRKIRELAFVFELDGFRSPDLTILSEHLGRSGFKEITYVQDPQSIVWCARNDGTLIGLTYERAQNVLGWHKHTLGGFSNAAKTAIPIVESVASIPAQDGSRDELWMVVKRSVNGVTKRYFEFLTKAWEQEDTQANAFYVDCGLTYNGPATTTISGLNHLAGETLKVLADGAVHPDVIVSATGRVTMTRSVQVAHFGYGYNSDGVLLRLNVGAADGTAQGKTQRHHKVTFRVLDTLGLKVGPNLENLQTITTRKSSDPMDTAVPLQTGDIKAQWEGDYKTEALIAFRFDTPMPGTILAIMPQTHTQDA